MQHFITRRNIQWITSPAVLLLHSSQVNFCYIFICNNITQPTDAASVPEIFQIRFTNYHQINNFSLQSFSNPLNHFISRFCTTFYKIFLHSLSAVRLKRSQELMKIPSFSQSYAASNILEAAFGCYQSQEFVLTRGGVEITQNVCREPVESYDRTVKVTRRCI